MNKSGLMTILFITLSIGSSSFATTTHVSTVCPKPERRFTNLEHRGGSRSIDFKCKSDDGCFKRCDLNVIRAGRPVSDARLVQQTSTAKCEEGVDWGWAMSTIWIDNGCEGVFRVYTY